MTNELKEYVEQALMDGADKKEIQLILIKSGWSDALVQKMLEQYKGVDSRGLLIPAPKTRFHQLIRDIFVYFISLVTLGMAAYALGDLLLRLVDFFFPDAANMDKEAFSQGMNWFTAQLIVAFPVYLLLARWTAKDVLTHPPKRDALVRKLMIYWILGITALVGIGDLITVFYNFLNGELTIRFVLQALVVFAVATVPFTYYFAEMKADDMIMKEGADE